MKRRRVLTIGTFDLFHGGHAFLLRECQHLGDTTIGVNSDQFVKDYKGITCTDDMLARCVSVKPYGQPVIHWGDTAKFIETRSPDYLVIGSDWARKDYYAQLRIDQDWLDARAIRLVYVPLVRGISSTAIRHDPQIDRKLDLS